MNFRILASDFAIIPSPFLYTNILLVPRSIAKEPSFLLLDENNTKVLSIGDSAKQMLGKTHDKIHLVKPIENGVITDFNLTEALLNYFFKKVNSGFSFLQPRVVICVPSGITDIQARAVEDAALHAGSRDVILVDESLAAAYGMDLGPDEPKGSLIVNLGGGVSEASVISLNGVITNKSINKGGDYIDSLIGDYFRDQLSLEIGENTAENVKNSVLSLRVKDKKLSIEVDGRDLETAMPKTVSITSESLLSCIMPFANTVVDMIYEVLEKTPPEISSDIKKNGIYLTGGLTKLRGLSEYISERMGLSVSVSEDPISDAIKGAGIILDNPDRFVKYRK